MPSRAQRLTIPFIGGTKRSKSAIINDQETVNMMQAVQGEGAKAPRTLESAPGIEDLGPLGDGAIRTSRMISSEIRELGLETFAVFGSKFVVQTATAGNLELGTLLASTGRVEMAAGRNYLALVDGNAGYTFDGTTFAQIADLDFPNIATHIRYIDGFFLANDPTTDNWYISALEDPTSWNALDFDAAAVKPDAATAIEVTTSLAWIFGPQSAQPYFNSGNPDFPYAIALSGVKDVGILAPYSLASSDIGIFYLGTTAEGGRFVYRISGMEGQMVTGNEEEDLLASVIDPTTAYGFIYQQSGKSFYVLQLGETAGRNARASTTMIYNFRARSWETRELQDGSAWRVGGMGVLNNQIIAGSRLGSRQLRLSLDLYTDSDQELIRRRVSQIYHSNNALMDWSELVVDVETGVGTGDGTANEDPIIRMRYWQEDIGDWTGYQNQSLGKQGETFLRIVYQSLGIGRSRRFELSCSSGVPFTIVAAYARVTVLDD